MHERYTNRKIYFEEQGITTKKYVIPYINKVKPVTNKLRILEIGCGEGGNLAPFIEIGCEVIGVDINTRQIEKAKIYIQEKYRDAKAKFIGEDIYTLGEKDIGRFDLVMLRDVIEHIPNQDKFLNHLRSLLNPDGHVFFGFPPWWMPFGGHQQTCHNKYLSKLPYFHLFPVFIYRSILKLFGEKESTINSLLEIKETGIGISKFQKLIAKNGFRFARKTFYLINPNYEIKFGLKPREQFKLIQYIPYFRDIVTTCLYSVVKLDVS